jgi:hypothetical protein
MFRITRPGWLCHPTPRRLTAHGGGQIRRSRASLSRVAQSTRGECCFCGGCLRRLARLFPTCVGGVEWAASVRARQHGIQGAPGRTGGGLGEAVRAVSRTGQGRMGTGLRGSPRTGRGPCGRIGRGRTAVRARTAARGHKGGGDGGAENGSQHGPGQPAPVWRWVPHPDREDFPPNPARTREECSPCSAMPGTGGEDDEAGQGLGAQGPRVGAPCDVGAGARADAPRVLPSAA